MEPSTQKKEPLSPSRTRHCKLPHPHITPELFTIPHLDCELTTSIQIHPRVFCTLLPDVGLMTCSEKSLRSLISFDSYTLSD